jgi:hypothetical protein
LCVCFELYADLPIALTIVHCDGTSILSLHTSKPKVHFDGQIAQLPGPSKPSVAPKPPARHRKPAAKPTKPTKSSIIPPTTEPTNLSAIQGLCSGIEGFDINGKAKKKARAEEIAQLTTLDLKGIIEEAKPLKEVQIEPFDLGDR